MKKNDFFLIFFNLLNIAFTFIPIWNLKESSIDLLPNGKTSENITIYDYYQDYSSPYKEHIHAVLNKSIEKNGNEINIKNIIQMKDNETPKNKYTEWEDITGYYIEDRGHFVCPKSKGKYFFNQYEDQEFKSLKPNIFKYDEYERELVCICRIYTNDDNVKWELQTFLFRGEETQICAIKEQYLNSGEDKNWGCVTIDNGIFDFLWTNKTLTSDYKKFHTYTLALKDKKLRLYYMKVFLEKDSCNTINTEQKTELLKLGDESEFTYAYFNYTNKTFYWMISNTTDDFKSGYSTISIIPSETDQKDYGLVNNNNSPFKDFVNNATIDELKIIRNTRFVYYHIHDDNNPEENYTGIIDIESNQIIFNTNETLKKINTLNFSLIVVTDETAYQVCFIKENGHCIERCPSNESLILDTIRGNYCGSNDSVYCEYFILKPLNICIEECRSDIYVTKDKECGFCKYLYPDTPYKLINDSNCLKEKPNNTYYVYEDFKIIDYCIEHCKNCDNNNTCNECYEGYKVSDNICVLIECNENCFNCTEYSSNETDQKCITCIDGLYLDEESHNCLQNCKEHYYIDNNKCLKCHDNCKNCTKGPEEDNENCASCYEDYYLIDIEDFPKNCTSDCPNETYISKDQKRCISKEEKEKEEKEEEEEKKGEKSIFLWIYIIVFGVILLIICICIYIKACSKKYNQDINYAIETELQGNNRLLLE